MTRGCVVACLIASAGCRPVFGPAPAVPIPPAASQPQAPANKEAAAAPATAASSAVLAGIVLYDGPAVVPSALNTRMDPGCTAALFDESVMVGPQKTLANVFVHIESELPFAAPPPPKTPMLLDFRACAFVPHVLGIQAGQKLNVRNSSVAHNVMITPKSNAPCNFGQPKVGMTMMLPAFGMAELGIPVTDAVHPWAKAYICVADHPYFNVTGSAGVFRLGDVPPGTYTLEAWHEVFGTQTAIVTVAAGDVAWVVFTLGPNGNTANVTGTTASAPASP